LFEVGKSSLRKVFRRAIIIGMKQRSQRILIVEDDFAIRNSVEFALRRAGYETKSLDSGQAAVNTVQAFDPDLVLLDVMLPGVSGHEICEELRRSDVGVAIIMMSALGETEDRITGLRLGADDYVSKPFSLDELLERVRANLRQSSRNRSDRISGKTDVLRFDGLVIDPVKHEASVDGTHVALRAKEFALLYALASRPGEVLSRKVLSEEVWGHDYLHSSRTIDVHIRRLRALLAESGAPDYLSTVHGVGYHFNADNATITGSKSSSSFLSEVEEPCASGPSTSPGTSFPEVSQ